MLTLLALLVPEVCSVYLLYKCQRYAQFTYFASIIVQILTQRGLISARVCGAPRQVYLLYWYKSTDIDAEGAGRC
jgi:hypothetical protein